MKSVEVRMLGVESRPRPALTRRGLAWACKVTSKPWAPHSHTGRGAARTWPDCCARRAARCGDFA
ncbi:hypothetical protein K1T71_004120 [Dendrolimus kikuchii]|uniref:Uncharacterized protein n=1 Tax=Dendrolimus kikuchii TaxID=765133 RepID=A0ACC1D9Y0_9NEOP|nr:hypothetical protein K1T71_004120 [Dendrolimus kikuchii]